MRNFEIRNLARVGVFESLIFLDRETYFLRAFSSLLFVSVVFSDLLNSPFSIHSVSVLLHKITAVRFFCS